MIALPKFSMTKVISDRRYGVVVAIAALLALPTGVSAATNDLNLSTVPPYLGKITEPNIVFMLDNSGSMQSEVMPELHNVTENVYPSPGNWGTTSSVYKNYFDPKNSVVVEYHSPSINHIYYNPTIRYEPWADTTGNGTAMANAATNCANYDPMAPNTNTCLDFTKSLSFTSNNGTTTTFWMSDYYLANGTHVVIKPSNNSYTDGSSARTDCANWKSCTYSEELQNYANWFQYYRTRILLAKGGIGRTFAQLPTGVRVGYGTIAYSGTTDGKTTRAVSKGVRHFENLSATKSYRTDFFTTLYNQSTGGKTPLRQALQGVGEYYRRNDVQNPWTDDPSLTTNNPANDSSCRQSYVIMATDGYWNGNTPSVSDADSTNGPKIYDPTDGTTTVRYTPAAPYWDNNTTSTYSNTLADVAMYYWNHDLRDSTNTALGNNVPISTSDPAFWQHMVTFTVGLGVNGTLNYASYKASNTLPSAWPQPVSNTSTTIDDLWHAGVNGHGGYYSASDPDQLVSSLSDALSTILGRQTTIAPLAVNSGNLTANQVLYQARFDTRDWSGRLKAIPYNVTTKKTGNATWDAQTQITAQAASNSRQIVTYNGTAGQPFQWTNLSISQQAALNKNASGIVDNLGSQRVSYLRGGSDPQFRVRTSGVLGDIIDSAPVYVGAPNLFYPDYWGVVPDPANPGKTKAAPENSVPYSAFVSTNASRAGMVYVGANDGMLHAIDAATGNEVFAYVPNVVYGNLSRLTDLLYRDSHRNFVDGPISVSDVFFKKDSKWHTVLVGALGGGGQGIYALDVTSPTAGLTETATATAKVLWEYTDVNDKDLGYTYGDVSIERMHDGSWAAVFGNGYNNMTADGHASTTGDSAIYVVDVETGKLIKKFDTGQGLTQSPSTPTVANGMAAPGVADVNSDGIADYIYAGDLQGNLWKFDVTNTNSTKWDSAYKDTAGNIIPMFVATDSSSPAVRQPITSGVDIGPQPSNYPGYMVYFGTGKLLEQGDNSATNQQTQTMYGVWDRTGGGMTQPTTSVARANLVQQKILSESTNAKGVQERALSSNPIPWDTSSGLSTVNPGMGWYMDLVNTGVTPLDNKGERVIVAPAIINDSVIFITMQPSTDPCSIGGDSWVMIINPANGGQHPTAKSQKSTVGMIAGVTRVTSGNLDNFLISGDKGIQDINGPQGTPVQGRQSWIRLR